MRHFSELNKTMQSIVGLAAIVTATGVIGTPIIGVSKVYADNRYHLKTEAKVLHETAQLERWQEQVELVELKEASEVRLSSDDKVKRSYYQNKIDKYNQQMTIRARNVER